MPLSSLLLASLALAAPPAEALRDRDQPIEIEAQRTEGNLRDTGVTVLSGEVRIRQGSLSILADRAEIHREGTQVGQVRLQGSPVRLEQALPDRSGTLIAEARSIDYDPERRRMILEGNVRIVEPRGELKGSRVEYDTETGRVRADGGRDAPVRIRIDPPAVPPAAA
ncbi:MAG: hypothetical protein KatS3mg125_2149 [Lysobacterales bacterium]|jgi:lipopolysaccharide export system protein LptA|nr:MAG: hypothetical protein KatS3mg125_2149 [Xanthomonadales bacterium]